MEHGCTVFESSVNPKGIKTPANLLFLRIQFESSVNPKGIKTDKCFRLLRKGLRVV